MADFERRTLEPKQTPGTAANRNAASPPVEELVDRFWSVGPGFHEVTVKIEAPETPLALLKQLGPSPFERGGFPLIGFLATTYEKVSRFALERSTRPNA